MLVQNTAPPRNQGSSHHPDHNSWMDAEHSRRYRYLALRSKEMFCNFHYLQSQGLCIGKIILDEIERWFGNYSLTIFYLSFSDQYKNIMLPENSKISLGRSRSS